MHDLSDGTPIFPSSTEGESFTTVEQMKARISLLSDEIDANEEENRAMQQEIDRLYAKIDAQKT